MSTALSASSSDALAGLRVALVGKFGGMSKREAQRLVREHGGMVVERPDATVQLIVFGEHSFPPPDVAELVRGPVQEAVDAGLVELATETQLWQRLGLVDAPQNIHRLYTTAMLADLLGVSVSVVRRWQRRKLIVPARQVRRLAYFDFQEVATARRLAEMLGAGISPQAIEAQLAALARVLPAVQRPLAQLSVIVEGKELLLRQGDGLIEPGGQRRFDFSAPEATAATLLSAEAERDARRETMPEPATLDDLRAAAARHEDEGRLDAAAETYRALLAMAGPDAEAAFMLAELLYRQGDLPAARERYYMALELDGEYIEARANLGCVLAELGELDLAIAAFEGALAHHGEYPDAHYHLARTLDDADRAAEADVHWRAFLELAPDSPWAALARERLGLPPVVERDIDE